MSEKHICYLNKQTMSIAIILKMIAMLMLFTSCGGKNKMVGEAVVERDSLPSMETLDVETFVSDSGVIRYRIEADEWLVFDRKRPSHWAFEKGLYLEQFDSIHQVEASIKADTAYYYDKQKLWKLIGNVDIQNRKGEKFNTQLLYWNQTTEKIYSDEFIRIEQPDRIITGYGFDSNQQMTIYQIHNMEGVFYVDETETHTTPVNTTLNDSTLNE